MSYRAHSHSHAIASYVVGFLTSLALTIMAFTIVINRETFSQQFVIGAIIGLALLQFFTQLVFFLHIGVDPRTRWKSFSFLSMIIVVAILVGGSLWIMYNLNYHMDHKDNHQVEEYLHRQSGL